MEGLPVVVGKIPEMSEKKFRITHYERDPVNGLGQYVTRQQNLQGNPFVVFCTSSDCEHYHERPAALPHWSDECEEYLGVLRCPACNAPVIRPPRE